MITLLDRYVLRSLLINYVIALGVMLSLYIALDLFINMDEFTEHGYPFTTLAGNIINYYWPNLFLYFKQLSGAITLFACMATVARMRKLNELTAVLASGVSLLRIAAPVLAFGAATTALLIMDTECLIPSVAHRLVRDHDDIEGTIAYEVLFLPDGENRLLSARRFNPTHRDLRGLLVLTRDEHGDVIETLEADQAVWEPPGATSQPGRWRLVRSRLRSRTPADDTTMAPTEKYEEIYPQYYYSDLNPKNIELRQAEGWIDHLSLSQIRTLEHRPGTKRADLIWTRHARIAEPLLSVVMLLLALPFFLDRTPGAILTDSSKCMAVCGLCYITAFVVQNVHSQDYPALPFWIPIFIFGTLAMVLIDRVRT